MRKPCERANVVNTTRHARLVAQLIAGGIARFGTKLVARFSDSGAFSNR
jgi:hypothetical protein